jgi:hypothetical protein
MSELILEKEKEILAQILRGMGLPEEYMELFFKDFARYREAGLGSYMIIPSGAYKSIPKEDSILSLALKVAQLNRTVIQSALRSYFRYIDYKKRIAQTYQESQSWYTVFSTDVYMDDHYANESFIDYLEELYQTQVRDVAHLQELTGITELSSYDSKTGEYVEPATDEEANQNAIKQLQDCLTMARYSKYSRALEVALQSGAKYKDLLEIKPQDYGLPESWEDVTASNQYTAILEAIQLEYLLGEVGGLILLPSLRAVANDLEAPYSVIMDSYNRANWIMRN